jgi:ATP-dependent Clp protease, protease subunit
MLQVNNKTNELLIYDVIGEDWFGGGITAKNIIAALDEFGGKRVTVRINSPGGVADEGIAIYNALKRYEGRVDTVIDSIAASAASVIALAGEKRTTSEGGRWMIHRAMALAIGNANDMTKTAEVLEKYDEALVEIYSGYMQKEPAAIMDMITAETWFNADEAILNGLATDKAKKTVDAEPVSARWFKNAPAALFSKPKAAMKPKPLSQQFYVR